jgi:magnesium-transporting ATPase (P-type)
MDWMAKLYHYFMFLAIVVNTGETTEVGKISSSLLESHRPLTPLQQKMQSLGKYLVAIALLSCACVIAIGVGYGKGAGIVKTGISLAVSVIPEGLVTIVTLVSVTMSNETNSKQYIELHIQQCDNNILILAHEFCHD